MKALLRFSMREMLMVAALVALLLTVVVLNWQLHSADARHRAELARLNNQLNAVYLLVGKLPVEDPDRAYVLAAPAYSYGRWVWRVYLPEGRRYVVHIDVGTMSENDGVPIITAARGYGQHFGLAGHGETVIVAQQFHQDNQSLLGVTVGNQETCCRLTPEVARSLATRAPYEEEQLGDTAPVDFAAGERIELVKRWYPPADAAAPDAPVGFSIWLKPL